MPDSGNGFRRPILVFAALEALVLGAFVIYTLLFRTR